MLVEPLNDAQEWESFVAGSPQGTFYHTLKWKNVLEEFFGFETHYLTIRHPSGVLVGVCPLVLARKLRLFKVLDSLPDSDFAGPLIRDEYAEVATHALSIYLRQLATKNSVVYARIRCNSESLSDNLRMGNSKVETPVGTMNLSLTDMTPDFLWENVFTKKGGQRKFIKRCEEAGLQNKEIESKQDLQAFYDLYSNNLRHIGAAPFAFRLFEYLYDSLYPDNFNVIVTSDNKRCFAAQGLFLYPERNAIYLTFLGIDREMEKRLHSTQYLHWGTIQWAQTRGFQFIGFGSTPSDPQSTQYLSKSKFGTTFNQDYVVYMRFNKSVFFIRERAVQLGRKLKKSLPKKLQGVLSKMGQDL